MDPQDTKKRIEEAYKLLAHETTSKEKIESIRTLIKGFSPKVDELLENISKALSSLEKLQRGDVIVLSAVSLPENSPEEKKRKQTIIFLINSWRQLEAEVKRVSHEFDQIRRDGEDKTASTDRITSAGRIVTVAKGPFGILTLAAIVIVGVFSILNNNNARKPDVEGVVAPKSSSKIEVIVVGDKKIPVTEVHILQGSECDNEEHYHAKNNNVSKAVDGTLIPDPGGCGFGKIKDVLVVDIENN